MKIAILSQCRRFYSTKRLLEEGERLGCQVTVFNPLSCQLLISPFSLRYGNRKLPTVDLILPRISNMISEYGLAVVNHFEKTGTPVINRAEAISRAHNKLKSLQFISAKGVRVPRTFFLNKVSDLEKAVEIVGGLPVVLKILQGAQGRGVMLVETLDSLRSVIDTLYKLHQGILIQEYIREAKGQDLRVIVVGGRIITAMRRKAQENTFRANFHLGGTLEPVKKLDRFYKEAALGATQAIGLEIAGVDILEASDGPRVIEVNSTPGLEGIEAITKINIAREIMVFAKDFNVRPQLWGKTRPQGGGRRRRT